MGRRIGNVPSAPVPSAPVPSRPVPSPALPRRTNVPDKNPHAATDSPAWQSTTIDEALQRLEVDLDTGLSEQQTRQRLEKYGPNELIEHGMKSPWKILWEQLTGLLIVVLIVAALISFFLGDVADAVAILAIVVLNALIGFRQEYRAERAMAALKKMAAPVVRVRREGHVLEVPSPEITVGDVVLLEAGSAVPADGRLVETANLRVEEAALTGESAPIDKHAPGTFDSDTPLGDRLNMAYSGTAVTYGRATMVVTDVGMQTELGHIATMIQTVSGEPTPLQRRLDRLGKVLSAVVLVIVAIVFVMGLMRLDWSSAERTEQIKVLFLTAVSMAVAAVPEGLPAVVTIALALGAQKMLQRHALIRKLPAVETLGSVTTICSDKTGTLTKNEMTVAVLDVLGRRVDVTEHVQANRSELRVSAGDVLALSQHPALALLVVGGALCNDALLERDGETGGDWRTVGDPTEAALVSAAARLGMIKGELEAALPRVDEVPFDSQRKRMTTLHRVEKLADTPLAAGLDGAGDRPHHLAFSKGAIDSLLSVCSDVWNEDHAEPLNDSWRKRIEEAHDRLADDGMRVLGIAFRRHDAYSATPEAEEKELVFIGLAGIIDPPRPEVAEAVGQCSTAGIAVKMVTGDHPLTARHIADDLGIDGRQEVVTGRELDAMSEAEFTEAVETTSVFARVSPENKLQLVKTLQKRGQVVAMTGDGVNDAPALKQADIGVAMGITGTDVSKEAAAMVLQDDNFATIVAAVREGRIVYDNIRKFIRYTMTSNAGEILVMLFAPLLGMPLPLLPLQILWINLVTDGLPGLALALEPGERNTMQRPPYPPREPILGRGMGWQIVWVGLLMGSISLLAGWLYWDPSVDRLADAEHRYWRTMVFMVLTLSQMGNVMVIRSQRDSLFTIGLFSNRWMLLSVALTFLLQLLVTYVPFFQEIFRTQSLTVEDLGLALIMSTVVFWAGEGHKWLVRRRDREDPQA